MEEEEGVATGEAVVDRVGIVTRVVVADCDCDCVGGVGGVEGGVEGDEEGVDGAARLEDDGAEGTEAGELGGVGELDGLGE